MAYTLLVSARDNRTHPQPAWGVLDLTVSVSTQPMWGVHAELQPSWHRADEGGLNQMIYKLLREIDIWTKMWRWGEGRVLAVPG